jgi:hypothetical protein
MCASECASATVRGSTQCAFGLRSPATGEVARASSGNVQMVNPHAPSYQGPARMVTYQARANPEVGLTIPAWNIRSNGDGAPRALPRQLTVR